MDKTLASIDFSRNRGHKHSLRQELVGWRPSGRDVVAAVCYRRQANGEVEFLLVRTRAGRWTFPKGGVDRDPTAASAAAREAYEEGGVRGQVEPLAFTWYLHHKNAGDAHTVIAHLCRVLHAEAPRELFRTPRWFTAERAKQRLREERPRIYAEELERVVDQALRRLEAGIPHRSLSNLN
jgi:8-oxo-dGTP pyrophosphatase MutT (NUDIX family)